MCSSSSCRDFCKQLLNIAGFVVIVAYVFCLEMISHDYKINRVLASLESCFKSILGYVYFLFSKWIINVQR